MGACLVEEGVRGDEISRGYQKSKRWKLTRPRDKEGEKASELASEQVNERERESGDGVKESRRGREITDCEIS